MATVGAGGGQLPGGARESGPDADQLRADRAGCGLGIENGREVPGEVEAMAAQTSQALLAQEWWNGRRASGPLFKVGR
jgi:hypothetical protein